MSERAYAVDAENGLVIGVRGSPIGCVAKNGYMIVRKLERKRGFLYAHRLIWEAVNGPIPTGLEINHVNGIKTDNRISNLEAVSPSENQRHACRTGLRDMAADKHPQARLTWDDVRAIRHRYERGMGGALAREYGVSRQHVLNIVAGKVWAA